MRLSLSKILATMNADVLSIEVVGLPENSLSSVLCWTSNVWDQRETVLRSVDESPKLPTTIQMSVGVRQSVKSQFL